LRSAFDFDLVGLVHPWVVDQDAASGPDLQQSVDALVVVSD
jgi:hypothetical protein